MQAKREASPCATLETESETPLLDEIMAALPAKLPKKARRKRAVKAKQTRTVEGKARSFGSLFAVDPAYPNYASFAEQFRQRLEQSLYRQMYSPAQPGTLCKICGDPNCKTPNVL